MVNGAAMVEAVEDLDVMADGMVEEIWEETEDEMVDGMEDETATWLVVAIDQKADRAQILYLLPVSLKR